jgi:hypothetical protein
MTAAVAGLRLYARSDRIDNRSFPHTRGGVSCLIRSIDHHSQVFPTRVGVYLSRYCEEGCPRLGGCVGNTGLTTRTKGECYETSCFKRG